MIEKPKPRSSLGEKELDKAQMQLDSFEDSVKELTLDNMNLAPKLELEPTNKISQQEIADSKDIYLKPNRAISPREKFNEDYRKDYNFAKEYVYFIAENHEVIGESITFWTRPFAGMPAEEWVVPVNKPIWAPRYVAERIKGCSYHRLTMAERSVSDDGNHNFYGQIVAKNTIQRLDALPASKRKSIFMGVASF